MFNLKHNTNMSSYLERFNYQLNGPENGKKWVFLHGLMGYGSNWRKIVSNLEISERILTFDQRGHGRSWKPLSGYAADDYAEDLFLILKELAWEKIILVGHSMGGRNALAFAAKYPELLERLVIEDIGASAHPEAIQYFQKLLDSVPTPFPNKIQAKEFLMNDWPKLNISTENNNTLAQYLYSNLEEKSTNEGNAFVDWRFSKSAILASVQLGRAKDMWAELRRLSMPTLLVRGERSKDLPKDEFAKMIASNPRVQGVEVANAGHWIHSDQPNEFFRVISQFATS